MSRFARLATVLLTSLVVLAGCFGSAPLPAQAAGGFHEACFVSGATYTFRIYGETHYYKFSVNAPDEVVISVDGGSSVIYKNGGRVFQELSAGRYVVVFDILDAYLFLTLPSSAPSVLPPDSGLVRVTVREDVRTTTNDRNYYAFNAAETRHWVTIVSGAFYKGFYWKRFRSFGQDIVSATVPRGIFALPSMLYRHGDIVLLNGETYRLNLGDNVTLEDDAYWIACEKGHFPKADQLIYLERVEVEAD